MRTLIPRIWAEGLDPKRSFIAEIREAANGIGAGLPEWFDGEESDFGPEVTRCVLEWEIRVAQREGVGPFEFIERIRTLENSLHGAGIDGKWVMAFVKARPLETTDYLVASEGEALRAEELRLGQPVSGPSQLPERLEAATPAGISAFADTPSRR